MHKQRAAVILITALLGLIVLFWPRETKPPSPPKAGEAEAMRANHASSRPLNPTGISGLDRFTLAKDLDRASLPRPVEKSNLWKLFSSPERPWLKLEYKTSAFKVFQNQVVRDGRPVVENVTNYNVRELSSVSVDPDLFEKYRARYLELDADSEPTNVVRQEWLRFKQAEDYFRTGMGLSEVTNLLGKPDIVKIAVTDNSSPRQQEPNPMLHRAVAIEQLGGFRGEIFLYYSPKKLPENVQNIDRFQMFSFPYPILKFHLDHGQLVQDWFWE